MAFHVAHAVGFAYVAQFDDGIGHDEMKKEAGLERSGSLKNGAALLKTIL
jgi:hypothetical protein